MAVPENRRNDFLNSLPGGGTAQMAEQPVRGLFFAVFLFKGDISMEAPNTVIQLEHFTCTGKNGKILLNNLNVSFQSGRKIALMGANGSGKSMLLRCLAGFVPPANGTAFFEDQPYGYSDEAQESLHKMISCFFYRQPHESSDGQNLMLCLEKIISSHPKVLLLDLPDHLLDTAHRKQIAEHLDQLAKSGTAVIFTTHDTSKALAFADEVILMEDGEIILCGTPEEVLVSKRDLAAAGLEMPEILLLFEALCQKAILNPGLSLPRTARQLEQYIRTLPELHYQRPHGNRKNRKTAVLAVSFGTSFHQTREKTIDRIEASLADAFPEAVLYRAWTSKMILKKLKTRDDIHIDNVKEAMERMISDGITDLIVQPTHVINGIENDLMKEEIMEYASSLSSITFGTPLLTSTTDNEEAIYSVMKEWELPKDEVLVFMGHGTTHYANAIYAALDYTFKDLGFPNVFLGTVEAYPSLQSLIRQVHAYHPKKIHLAPFMIVAGDHASNDMSGDDPDSWKSQFEAEGFAVECHMKGLGEYEGIRNLFVRHAQEAAEQKKD